MAKVAVIMCVYYRDKLEYLKLAVESIVNQTFQDIDLYIYCDGLLPDDVMDYINAINDTHVVKSKLNKGLAFGLNNLIDRIVSDGSYEYVARMDSDDISRPERISEQVKFMLENSTIDVSGSYCREFGSDFALNEKKVPLEFDEIVNYSITRCPFIHPTVIFRMRVFNDGIRYPESTSYTEDLGLWYLMIDAGYKMANLNKVLLDYRLNDSTILRRNGYAKMKSEIALRLKYMFILKRVCFSALISICSRFFLLFAPKALVRFIYKKCR